MDKFSYLDFNMKTKESGNWEFLTIPSSKADENMKVKKKVKSNLGRHNRLLIWKKNLGKMEIGEFPIA